MVAMTTMIILMTEMDTRDILIPTEEIPGVRTALFPGPEITIFKGFRSPQDLHHIFCKTLKYDHHHFQIKKFICIRGGRSSAVLLIQTLWYEKP